MSYYQKHVFFCNNVREDGKACCSDNNAQEMRIYAKKKIKALDLNGQGKVRINSAGCLDRCNQRPVLVVYPEAVWYTYAGKEDIDEIVERHLINDEVVERLKI